MVARVRTREEAPMPFEVEVDNRCRTGRYVESWGIPAA